MSNTYEKDGHQHSRFANRDGSSGESITQNLWEYLGYEVKRNDIQDGVMDYEAADFVGTREDHTLYIEAEGKADSLWHHIENGLDIPLRKGKYFKNVGAKNFIHTMVQKESQQEIVLTLGIFLEAASKCKGYYAHGKVPTDPTFIMPHHGCCIVRKNCKTSNGWEQNDFFRIPYRYLGRYVKSKNCWKLVKRPEFKLPEEKK
ncbi:MAG: hypothetical protein ACW99G_07235 [Candidatus Thorarchaeota archaeon]|jgi:hypothetical protein